MQLREAMKRQLYQTVSWSIEQIPVLESPVLLILDYSPGADEQPLSIAFDCGFGPKCWMTVSEVRKIGSIAPKYHERYKEFIWEGRTFRPYSIRTLPRDMFENIDTLMAICRQLYRHAVWE